MDTDHGQATGKLYHLRLRVECIRFCKLQSRVRTHAVLVIGLQFKMQAMVDGNQNVEHTTSF
jgi:hypothetical protein